MRRADGMTAAALLYDGLRDWLERHRLVDVGLLPSGVPRPATVGDRRALTVRGVPVGRFMAAPDDPGAGPTLVLFLPPYVRGATALEATRELAAVLRNSGLAIDATVETGESNGKQDAA
jgi:hypothetical protein